VKVWRFRSDGLAADHGDAGVGHEVGGSALQGVRAEVRGRAGILG